MPSNEPQVHLRNPGRDIDEIFDRERAEIKRTERMYRRYRRRNRWRNVAFFFHWLRHLVWRIGSERRAVGLVDAVFIAFLLGVVIGIAVLWR